MSVKVLVRAIPAQILPDFQFGEDTLQALRLLMFLLKPASLAAFLLATWRFVADLGWTSEFLISDGLASHWQLWAVLGVVMWSVETAFEKSLNKQ